jgi:hypothetical protein
MDVKTVHLARLHSVETVFHSQPTSRSGRKIIPLLIHDGDETALTIL